MTTSDKLRLKYGDPKTDKSFEKRNLVVWKYPADIREAIPALGTALYCNKDLIEPLERTFRNLIEKGLNEEIIENDQCFCIRPIRGIPGEMSVHSWAMAIDLNPTQNPLGYTRKQCETNGLTPFTEKFLQVWRDMGWNVGADFHRKDLMHFEWTKNI